jgi:hypothetical protein
MRQINLRYMNQGQTGVIRRVSAEGELGRRIRGTGEKNEADHVRVEGD